MLRGGEGKAVMTMLKKTMGVVLILIVLPLFDTVRAEEDYNLSRTLKPIAPERFLVYKAVIVPWLEAEFTRSAWIDEGALIKRRLVKSNLLRFEDIGGQERYNVHIEYRVFIRDPSGVELEGTKGQEIVFWIEDGRLMDYFPFEEYWIKAVVLQERDYF